MNEAGCRWVMINCTGDTLTDSASGGIANWVLGVVRAAKRAGTTVPVITKAHAGVPASWPHAVEIHYPRPAFKGSTRVDVLIHRRTGFPHPWQPRWNRRVLEAVAAVAPEPSNLLFHNDPELAAVVAEAMPQHRVWHLLHNTNPVHQLWKARFVERVHSLAISDFIARWWEEEMGPPCGTVHHIPSGVDTELFSPGRKTSPPLVTYVGLLNERKGPDLLLEACETLSSENARPHFSVQLIGAKHYGRGEEDSYTGALGRTAARIRERGVEVRFSGFLSRPDVARALSASSIHVVPSRWEEPFSLAALEGMACGAATVVSDRGGLPEAVADAGMIVPAGDPVTLAKALRHLLEDGATRSDLARRGRKRALDSTWARTWQHLVTLPASRV